MRNDRQRELFEPARIMPPKPSIPKDPAQYDLVAWLSALPKAQPADHLGDRRAGE